MTAMLTEYGITRNVDATDEHGKPVKIAMVVIKHANGFEEPLAIREDYIKWAGEGIIEQEVQARAKK